MEKNWRKKVFTTLKIIISIGLLYFVLSKLNWTLLKAEWKNAEKSYLILAFLSFLISQIFSVLRLDIFLKASGIQISFAKNAKLYLLGMFYNFFIPGGVGGDAYKVYALNKSFDISLKEISTAVFLDRFIGLCAIVVLIFLSFIFLPIDFPKFIVYGLFTIGCLSIVVGPKILGLIFKKFKNAFYSTLGYSLVIQAFQIGTILLALLATHPENNMAVYASIFLISSVLSVISFAGIGIRETVFYYAADYMDFNPDVAAGIALIFSIITLITSLFGIIYLFKKIDLK